MSNLPASLPEEPLAIVFIVSRLLLQFHLLHVYLFVWVCAKEALLPNTHRYMP
jgi:hypothetical protein